jgi:hypothetical protein
MVVLIEYDRSKASQVVAGRMRMQTRKLASPGRCAARQRAAVVAAVVGAVTPLAACSGSDDPSLVQTLDRIDAKASRFFLFVDVAAVNDAVDEFPDDVWGRPEEWGRLHEMALGTTLADIRETIPESLGIDVLSADTLMQVSSGEMSDIVVLVEGGQDEATIASAAAEHDWSGDDLLTIDEPMPGYLRGALPYTQMRPDESDVMLGFAEADVSVVDPEGATLADDSEIAALVDCAGDVLAASYFDEAFDYPVLVAVRDELTDDDSLVSVMCVAADTETDAVADAIEADLDDWTAERLSDPTIEVVDDNVVQLVATNTPGTPANFMQESMLTRLDLPGLEIFGRDS